MSAPSIVAPRRRTQVVAAGLGLALVVLFGLVWTPAFQLRNAQLAARNNALEQTARFEAIAAQTPELRAALAAQSDQTADARLWPEARTRALAGADVQAQVSATLSAAGLTVNRATLRLDPGPEAAVLAVFEVEGGYADMVRGLASLDARNPRAFVAGLDLRQARGRTRTDAARYIAVVEIAAVFVAITAEAEPSP
ncbi:MAG: GspMb/PilO family protein [Maricaulaceae bacterium]